MIEERTITVRRIKTGSVFRILAAGIFGSMLPFALLMGVLSLFGLNTVNWNNEPVTGAAGLLISPLVGVMVAAVFTAFGGVGVAFGLWIYSKFRPLRLQFIEDANER